MFVFFQTKRRRMMWGARPTARMQIGTAKAELSNDAQPGADPRITDILEDPTGIQTGGQQGLSSANDMAIYRDRVFSALRHLFTHDPTLHKIRRGEYVSQSDLDALTLLVLTQSPSVDLRTLREFYPDTAGSLEDLLRGIVGMEPEVVDQRFSTFAGRYPLTGTQTQFLAMLKREIAAHGRIPIQRLYDAPFTAVHSAGLDGVFRDEQQIQELLGIVRSFEPTPPGKKEMAATV